VNGPGPVLLGEGDLDLRRWIGPGDGIVFGQACAEPVVLVDALLAQADSIGGLRAFAGLSWGSRLANRAPAALQIVSYGALGGTGRVAGLQVVPCHFSALPRLFAARTLPGDVALVQVAPPDRQGRCSYGVGVDYLADAVPHARVVIAEVNDRCPSTAGPWIDWNHLTAAVMTSRPLLEAPPSEPSDVDRQIAVHVSALVRDGDTIQLGVGALPDAIMQELAGHRDLGIHSGMITDGVLDLIEAGAVTGEHKPVDQRVAVTGAALGSRRLFDALDGREDVMFRPVSYTHSPATLANVGRLCAINSALEIDLTGQANSESVDGRRLGAVGGQVDFLRAAAASGGRPILALPSARIVKQLHGPISAARGDVDWVVTEHGARSLAGLTDAERAAALLEVAGGDVTRRSASPSSPSRGR
jgi:acyl-CoA hydrolase